MGYRECAVSATMYRQASVWGCVVVRLGRSSGGDCARVCGISVRRLGASHLVVFVVAYLPLIIMDLFPFLCNR